MCGRLTPFDRHPCSRRFIYVAPETYVRVEFECAAAVLTLRILLLIFSKFDFCAEAMGTFEIG